MMKQDFIGDPKDVAIDHKQGVFRELATLPKEYLRWIGENNNELITIWDECGKVNFLSKSVLKLLDHQLSDIENDDLLNFTWKDYVLPEDVTYIQENFDYDTMENQVFTINVLTKYGEYICTECIISKIKGDKSDVYHYIALLKDITDKKVAEEMMIRSEKMTLAGQLAAGIAHEIRNPLTSLKGFLQLLQAGVNRKDAYYKIMIDEIEKMEAISTELLFISKPLTDNTKEECIEEMICDVIVLLQSQANLKSIELTCKSSSKNYIYCDRSQIKQVLINIVKNAIESMEEPGTITIHVLSVHSQMEIHIIDEGQGIPDEIIHKLGEPFFTTKESGTGLGLMISKQILKRHDATLEIHRNVEKGSTFKIIFS